MTRTEKQEAREAANQQRSLEAFMAAKAAFDALVAELQAMSADHFGADPETVVWEHAEMLKDWNTRLGITETALRKAASAGRIAREPDGQWDIDKTRRRLVETADPSRSPLGGSATADGTPFARLKVAQLALKVEAQRLALDESKRRLIDVAEADATIDEVAGAMRGALLNWRARVAQLAVTLPQIDLEQDAWVRLRHLFDFCNRESPALYQQEKLSERLDRRWEQIDTRVG